MKIKEIDNNEFLADGSQNPNYGIVTVIEVPDLQPQSKNEPTIAGPLDLTAWLTAIAAQVGAKLPPITGK